MKVRGRESDVIRHAIVKTAVLDELLNDPLVRLELFVAWRCRPRLQRTMLEIVNSAPTGDAAARGTWIRTTAPVLRRSLAALAPSQVREAQALVRGLRLPTFLVEDLIVKFGHDCFRRVYGGVVPELAMTVERTAEATFTVRRGETWTAAMRRQRDTVDKNGNGSTGRLPRTKIPNLARWGAWFYRHQAFNESFHEIARREHVAPSLVSHGVKTAARLLGTTAG